MSWLSQGLGVVTGGLIGDKPGGGGADPRKFQQPINTGPQMPQTLPLSSTPGAGGFSPEQQAQLQNAFSAAGVWDTIKNIGGDVWGVIAGLLPKNADGSIDWGGALKDVGSWVKDNKDTILQGLSAINQYQRSQKSDEYAKRALDLATKSYDAKAPLREAGQAGMLNPQANTPDLSALGAQGQAGLGYMAPSPIPLAKGNLANAQQLAGAGNPFAKRLPLAPPAPTPQAPAIPTLPLATMPVKPPTPGAPIPQTPGAPPTAALPLAPPTQIYRPAQSGKIKNGPQDRY